MEVVRCWHCEGVVYEQGNTVCRVCTIGAPPYYYESQLRAILRLPKRIRGIQPPPQFRQNPELEQVFEGLKIYLPYHIRYNKLAPQFWKWSIDQVLYYTPSDY